MLFINKQYEQLNYLSLTVIYTSYVNLFIISDVCLPFDDLFILKLIKLDVSFNVIALRL